MCETHQHINKILTSGYLGLFSSIIDLGPSLPYHDLEVFSKSQILLKELKSLVWYQMPLGHRGACNMLIEWRDTFQCKWKVMYTFHYQYIPCCLCCFISSRHRYAWVALFTVTIIYWVNFLSVLSYVQSWANPESWATNPESWILNPELTSTTFYWYMDVWLTSGRNISSDSKNILINSV